MISLLDWASSQTTGLSNYHVPVGGLVKAVERHAKLQKPEGLFQDSVRRFVEAMRASHSKDVRRHATTLEQYCIAVEAKASDDTVDARPVVAAAAGHPAVLTKLKSRLGIPVDETTVVESTPLDPDHFPLRHDSPYEHEHRLLSGLFQQLIGPHYHEAVDLSTCDAGRTVLKMTPAEQGRMLLAACERVMHGLLSSTDLGDAPAWQASYIANSSVETIAGLDCSLDRAEIFDAMLYCSTRPSYEQTKVGELVHDAVSVLLNATEKPSLSEGERYVLSLLRTSLIKGPPLGAPGDDIVQLTRLIGDGAAFYLTPTEKWSVMLNQEIAGYPLDQRSAWVALLRHCVGATASRPSDKWLKQAAKLVEQIGVDIVRSSLLRWFSKVPAGRVTAGVPAYHLDTRSTGDIIQEENSTILRGLLWITPTLNGGDEMTRQIGVVANSAYKKVPGVGPRAVKVGNAAIYAIGTELAVGQLAMLKVRVKFGAAQKEIEKAFNVAAERLGLPREEIEELGVPSYGLEEVGLRRETFGDAQAELRVDGRDVALHWTNNGKPVKSVPAKVKADHKDDLKELQSAVKDIAAMLPAQSERLDAMFLLQKRWPVDQWRARYLDHPLVGTLARRLIWTDGAQAFVHHNDRLVDAQDREVVLASEAQVTLWHPIDRPTDEVLTWRDWFTRHEIRQPFKQAHREVYLLTDAERNTHTYSNRYAAHILRQHQFNALCAARGWKNKLRLMVDNDYPPTTRLLPQWGLRAEYWVEGIGGDYGTDTNESGAFLRLVNDQIR
ncbi:MAG TPA: DUF4132 domain-containing protein, partial [Tepidisphaeraceae bacterium]|nr:DUF4132 domain-containing protein [Tepidisphaeraceae bacterium]